MSNHDYRLKTGALLVMVLVMLTSGSCHIGNRSLASRTTSQVAEDASICELLSAGQVRAIAGQLPATSYGSHKKSVNRTTLMCSIGFEGAISPIEIRYERDYAYEIRVPGDGSQRFDNVVSLEGASPLAVDGLDGSGVLFKNILGTTAIAWGYPDGYVLSMSMRNHTEGDQTYNDRMNNQNVQILTEIINQIGNRTPSVASSPDNTTIFP